MSMMVSFVLSFFPRDVLDEILNLIESVSEDFPSYSSVLYILKQIVQLIRTITFWSNIMKYSTCFYDLSTIVSVMC